MSRSLSEFAPPPPPLLLCGMTWQMLSTMLCRLLQVLVQALGVNVDMTFIMATFGVLSDLPTEKTVVWNCCSCFCVVVVVVMLLLCVLAASCCSCYIACCMLLQVAIIKFSEMTFACYCKFLLSSFLK